MGNYSLFWSVKGNVDGRTEGAGRGTASRVKKQRTVEHLATGFAMRLRPGRQSGAHPASVGSPHLLQPH